MSDNSNTSPERPPAGWYPDPSDPARQRYWDGAQWTEHAAVPLAETAAAGAVGSGGAAGAAGAGGAVAVPRGRGLRTLKWWQWVLIAFAAIVVLSIIINGINGGRESADGDDARPAAGTADITPKPAEPSEKPVEMVQVPDLVGLTIAEARVKLEAVGLVLAPGEAGDDWVVTAQQPAAGSHPREGLELSVTSEAPKPVYTLEQENALEAAQSYLKFSSFSRQGLIDQLSSEYGSGFPVDVATWAADTVGADWNAEAVEAAKSYLEFSSFSRSGLFDQLTSEYGSQFTPEQAEYALSQVGY